MNTPRLSENTVNLIRDLALAFGPSGMEDGAAEVIRAEAEKIPGMAVSRDPLGSVILHLDRSAPGVPGKKLLFTAGMDEQSFMLTERTGDGDRYFRAKGLGRVDHRALYSRLMLLGNEETQVPALFGGKPLHLTEGGERTSPDGEQALSRPLYGKKGFPEGGRLGRHAGSPGGNSACGGNRRLRHLRGGFSPDRRGGRIFRL